MMLFSWINVDIFVEILGYIGMAVVIISFMFKDIKTVRLINVAGSALCLVYGVFTNTMPTAILNLLMLLLNTGMLVGNRIKRKAEKERNQSINS